MTETQELGELIGTLVVPSLVEPIVANSQTCAEGPIDLRSKGRRNGRPSRLRAWLSHGVQTARHVEGILSQFGLAK